MNKSNPVRTMSADDQGNDAEAPQDAPRPSRPRLANLSKEDRLKGVRNKIRRTEEMGKIRREKKKEKRVRQEERKKARETLGEDKVPKLKPRTIESTREEDVTTVAKSDEKEGEEDEETLQDISADEMKSYFDHDYVPKVLITSADNPHKVGSFKI